MQFNFKNVKWGTSTKADGAMNLRPNDLDPQNVQNRKAFFEKVGINPADVVATALAHGTRVTLASEEHKGQILPDTDGLITAQKDLFLTVTAADCAPIFFYDPKNVAIGLAHAGWRGVVKNIAKVTIDKMAAEFNSNPKDLAAHIGPHIRKCHFEVQSDVASQFDPKYVHEESSQTSKDGQTTNSVRTTIDLAQAIKDQLTAAGIALANITANPDCTFCNDQKYFSSRRDNFLKVKSIVAYIGLV